MPGFTVEQRNDHAWNVDDQHAASKTEIDSSERGGARRELYANLGKNRLPLLSQIKPSRRGFYQN